MLSPWYQLVYFIGLEMGVLFPFYIYSFNNHTVAILILAALPIPPLYILWLNKELSFLRLGLTFDIRDTVSLSHKTNLIIGSYFVQVAVFLMSYGIFWLAVPGSFDSSYRGMLSDNKSVYLDLFLDLLVSSLFLTVMWAIVGLSEEITWRGYLVPLLNDLFGEIPSYIISGLVWVLFHYPFIFGIPSQFIVSYQVIPLWYTCLFFTLILIGVSLVMGVLRLRTGSIITACLIHGGNNALTPVFLPRTPVEYHYYLGIGSPIQAVIWLTIGLLTWKYYK